MGGDGEKQTTNLHNISCFMGCFSKRRLGLFLFLVWRSGCMYDVFRLHRECPEVYDEIDGSQLVIALRAVDIDLLLTVTVDILSVLTKYVAHLKFKPVLRVRVVPTYRAAELHCTIVICIPYIK